MLRRIWLIRLVVIVLISTLCHVESAQILPRESQRLRWIPFSAGSFTRERQTIASPDSCEGSMIATGDLDGDGLSDAVIGYAQEGDEKLILFIE
jgi:hypothetical protein